MLKEIIKYLLIITALFGVITGVMIIFQEGYQIELLTLGGAILACTFIITIRNPFNYAAFVVGAASSLVLTVALWHADLNSALTYLLVFFPAQVYSFFVWRRQAALSHREGNSQAASPRWQTGRERLLTLIAGVGIMAADVTVALHLAPRLTAAELFWGALLFTAAIIANITLIYKLTDSRIYWVLFSCAGLGVSLSHGTVSLYMVLMFLVFFIINLIVLIDWIKATRS